jgi:hypothetical protein
VEKGEKENRMQAERLEQNPVLQACLTISGCDWRKTSHLSRDGHVRQHDEPEFSCGAGLGQYDISYSTAECDAVKGTTGQGDLNLTEQPCISHGMQD